MTYETKNITYHVVHVKVSSDSESRYSLTLLMNERERERERTYYTQLLVALEFDANHFYLHLQVMAAIGTHPAHMKVNKKSKIHHTFYHCSLKNSSYLAWRPIPSHEVLENP